MSTKKLTPPPKKRKLLTADERRDAALKIAVKLAKKDGARRVSLAKVAAEQGVTAPLLFHIFGSHAAFVKAVEKTAKSQGVTLPAPTPTVRELRAAKHKANGTTKPKKAAPLAKPAKKVAALLKPKKAMPLVKPKARVRKPLTAAQKQAKAAADKLRRGGVSPTEKFKSLPTPFQASVQQALAAS